MGSFVGHFGGFIILAAVVALFGVFLLELGIIKDRKKLILNSKAAIMTAIIGIVYYFITGYIINVLKGQVNIFNFGPAFNFWDLQDKLSAYENISQSGDIKGVFIPAFAWTVHILGKVIFGQYASIAIWLNLASVCAGACCLYRMACDFFKKDVPLSMLLYIFALPYTFLLFTPGGWGMALGFAAIASYAFYKKHYILYGLLAAIAVCMGKYGLFALAAPAVGLSGFSVCIRKLADNRIVRNPYVRNGFLYVMFVLNSVIMFNILGG